MRLQPPPSAPLSRPTSAHLHGILKQPGKSWRRCGDVRGRSIALGRGLCAQQTAPHAAYREHRVRPHPAETRHRLQHCLQARARTRATKSSGRRVPAGMWAKRDAIYSESRPDVGQTRRHPCTGCMWWQASFMDATHTMAGGPGADVLAAPPMRSGDEPAEASAGPAAGACAVHARVRTYRWMRGTTAHAKCVVACALGRCNMRP